MRRKKRKKRGSYDYFMSCKVQGEKRGVLVPRLLIRSEEEKERKVPIRKQQPQARNKRKRKERGRKIAALRRFFLFARGKENSSFVLSPKSAQRKWEDWGAPAASPRPSSEEGEKGGNDYLWA